MYSHMKKHSHKNTAPQKQKIKRFFDHVIDVSSVMIEFTVLYVLLNRKAKNTPQNPNFKRAVQHL